MSARNKPAPAATTPPAPDFEAERERNKPDPKPGSYDRTSFNDLFAGAPWPELPSFAPHLQTANDCLQGAAVIASLLRSSLAEREDFEMSDDDDPVRSSARPLSSWASDGLLAALMHLTQTAQGSVERIARDSCGENP